MVIVSLIPLMKEPKNFFIKGKRGYDLIRTVHERLISNKFYNKKENSLKIECLYALQILEDNNFRTVKHDEQDLDLQKSMQFIVYVPMVWED